MDGCEDYLKFKDLDFYVIDCLDGRKVCNNKVKGERDQSYDLCKIRLDYYQSSPNIIKIIYGTYGARLQKIYSQKKRHIT